MSKRKILSLALTLCMVAILAVGGSLAYFMDTTDVKVNTFTVGNVNITLNETFDQNSKLIPATGSAQAGTLQNGIEKDVWVTNNEGSEDAFVRVHIAIPTILDDGDPTFNAAANTLHFNYEPESVAAGEWNWKTTDGDWNAYTANVDGVDYNVYVVTYQTALAENEATKTQAMYQVYLDSKTTAEQIESISKKIGNEWKILVAAEGVQADGFEDDAYAAFAASFGAPTSTANPFNNYGKVEG